jgi:hypothetical protein
MGVPVPNGSSLPGSAENLYYSLEGRDRPRVRLTLQDFHFQKGADMRIFIKFSVLVFLSSAALHPSHAEEACGRVNERKLHIDESARFRLLGDYGGKAFIDMRTCLVWRLDISDGPVLSLNDAMGACSEKGQGGPNGEMGWQLPTVAQLTSLDSDQWSKQKDRFEEYKLPPAVRTEGPFWTATAWPGHIGSWAVVHFSARTTIVRPSDQDTKAGAWCVRGFPATGIQ